MGLTVAKGKSNARWKGNGETLEAAAKRLGCGPATISKLQREGLLKKVPGGEFVRVPKENAIPLPKRPKNGSPQQKAAASVVQKTETKNNSNIQHGFQADVDRMRCGPLKYEIDILGIYFDRLKRNDNFTVEEQELFLDLAEVIESRLAAKRGMTLAQFKSKHMIFPSLRDMKKDFVFQSPTETNSTVAPVEDDYPSGGRIFPLMVQQAKLIEIDPDVEELHPRSFGEQYPKEYRWIVDNEKVNYFANGILEWLKLHGSLTGKQLSAVQRSMARCQTA